MIKFLRRFILLLKALFFPRSFQYGKELKKVSVSAASHVSSHDKKRLGILKAQMKKNPNQINYPNTLFLISLQTMITHKENDKQQLKQKLLELNRLSTDWLLKL